MKLNKKRTDTNFPPIWIEKRGRLSRHSHWSALQKASSSSLSIPIIGSIQTASPPTREEETCRIPVFLIRVGAPTPLDFRPLTERSWY